VGASPARDFHWRSDAGEALGRQAMPFLNDVDRWQKQRRKRTMNSDIRSGSMVVAAMTLMALAPIARADDGKMIELSVKDHKFEPAEPKAAAGSALVLKIKNLDAAPIEFESLALEFEIVVKSNAELLVKVKPQKPGRYLFFDDLHQEAKGTLVVE
jgi:Cupredoxin-like domain